MKKQIILLLIVAILLSGCGKTIPTLQDGSEAVVTFDDGSMISVDDLYEELKTTYARSAIIDMIDTKILEDKYKDNLEDAEEYAKNYVESLKNYYVDEDGNYDEASLVSAIQQYYGYNSLAIFQEKMRINYLANLAIEDYAKSIVTDKEIEKYYKNEIVPDRDVSHIQIIPEVTDTMTDDEKTAAEEEALSEAKSIIAKLKKGEKFEDLAKEYSDDEATKEDGGSLGTINKGTYGSDAFDEEVYSLKVGSYSTVPVETTEGYEIVYVTKEYDKASLDDVKDDIIEALSNELLSDDATISVTAMEELRKSYGMNIIDTDIKKDYNDYMDDMMDAAKASNAS